MKTTSSTNTPPDSPSIGGEPAAAEAPDQPTIQSAVPMLQAAMGQIDFVRRYVLELLAATPAERWYEIPSGLPTNVAWQAGHLAVSQYGLLMFRIRGRRPEDLELIPGKFRKMYGRGSAPSADPQIQPSSDELLDRLAEVDQRAREELRGLDPAVLLQAVEMPYAAYPIKLGAVLFCPVHEQLHAGQIGLIRRSLGLDPIR